MIRSAFRAIVAILGTRVALAAAGQSTSAPQKPAPPSQQSVRDPAGSPPTATGTGLIAGTVTTLDSGRPARRARVSLSGGDPRIARAVSTDEQGGFSFADLPPGQFVVSASKPGFLHA